MPLVLLPAQNTFQPQYFYSPCDYPQYHEHTTHHDMLSGLFGVPHITPQRCNISLYHPHSMLGGFFDMSPLPRSQQQTKFAYRRTPFGLQLVQINQDGEQQQRLVALQKQNELKQLAYQRQQKDNEKLLLQQLFRPFFAPFVEHEIIEAQSKESTPKTQKEPVQTQKQETAQIEEKKHLQQPKREEIFSTLFDRLFSGVLHEISEQKKQKKQDADDEVSLPMKKHNNSLQESGTEENHIPGTPTVVVGEPQSTLASIPQEQTQTEQSQLPSPTNSATKKHLVEMIGDVVDETDSSSSSSSSSIESDSEYDSYNGDEHTTDLFESLIIDLTPSPSSSPKISEVYIDIDTIEKKEQHPTNPTAKPEQTAFEDDDDDDDLNLDALIADAQNTITQLATVYNQK